MAVLALVALLAAGDVTVTFMDPPVQPPPGLSRAARDAGVERDPNAGSGSSNISFGIVRDLADRGPLGRMVAGRISSLDVTWSDPALFRGRPETEDFLRRLLAAPSGSTLTHVPWAQALPVPSVVATVRHVEGDEGIWQIWYSWPSIYFAYRDGRGTWWLGYWQSDESLRLAGTSP
jgi:hypothetical protein